MKDIVSITENRLKNLKVFHRNKNPILIKTVSALITNAILSLREIANIIFVVFIRYSIHQPRNTTER